MMTLSNFFIGRPIYWVLIVAVVAALAFLGMLQMHVRNFVPFQFIVLGISILSVAVVLAAYKPDERATRDPLNPEDLTD